MFRTILKIGYITVVLVLAVLFGVLNYNTGADDVFIDKLREAVASEDSKELANVFSAFSLPYDGNPYVKVDTDGKNNLTVFGSVNMLNVSYTETVDGEEKSQTYKEVENVYYVFIKNINYSDGNKIDGDNIINKTGLRFYNEDGKYYDYHFVVDKNINKEEYSDKIDTPTKGLVNAKRDLNNLFRQRGTQFDFIVSTISESLVSYIKVQLDNKDIVKFNLLDRDGEKVYNLANDLEVRFDFSQQFFSDIKTFRDSFRLYYGAQDQEAQDYKDAVEYLEKFKVTDLNNANYLEGLKKDEIYNAKLVWRSIGISALFVLAFTIVYILLFHFKLIKRIIFRENRNKGRYVPNKVNRGNYNYQPKKKTEAIDAEVKEIKAETPKSNNAEEVKSDKENN
ncbi:MAG: hypothetical protein IKP77_04335 [Acholeplasmatales bacterium]|nr:hypothetical protein [Acholeplasmatales bacterium]